MAEKTNPVPPGFHTLTPHLTVRDADKALEFYKNALGAEILGVARMPDGKIMHAALRIGDSMLMLNEEMPEYGGLSPLSLGGTAVTVHVYTDNVDDAFNRAVSAGRGGRFVRTPARPMALRPVRPALCRRKSGRRRWDTALAGGWRPMRRALPPWRTASPGPRTPMARARGSA